MLFICEIRSPDSRVANHLVVETGVYTSPGGGDTNNNALDLAL